MADLLAEYIDARVERLSPTIAAITDPLVVIEASWDADLEGARVFLYAVTDTFSSRQRQSAPPHPQPHDHAECHPRYRSHQLWFFPSEVDDVGLMRRLNLYTVEGRVVAAVGTRLAERFQVPFFCPSPETLDLDAPRWWQQHLAHQCRGCRKLQLPHTVPGRPADLCYDCWIAAKAQARRTAPAQADGGMGTGQDVLRAGDAKRRPSTDV